MSTMIVRFLLVAAMLLALPLVGIGLTGRPIETYLEFPPRTLYVHHAPFSWPAFVGLGLLILLVVTALLFRALSGRRERRPAPSNPLRFPWWGWIGIVSGLVFWTLAWTRFPWFSFFQTHTFTPLWIAYIVTINALCYARTGQCLLLDRPIPYLLLFPLSAGFWWFFEYLNRFVQNWYYPGVSLSPQEYFTYATLSFSTVLPAVTGTRQWLLSFTWTAPFNSFLPIRVSCPRLIAALTLGLSAAGLSMIGIWPEHLFGLLWIAPLLILVSLQALAGEEHIFSALGRGEWVLVLTSALAALQCGLFWEMWNFFSLAKWKYQVPLVDRFHLFEMPILGYAGYLPFGVECAVIADMVLPKRHTQ